MTFKQCSVCGEQKIIWDLDRDGDEYTCIDDCFASYDKLVGIKLIAPEVTDEQRDVILENALDICKSFGTAKEAAQKLRYLSFKVEPGSVNVSVEDALPSVGLGHAKFTENVNNARQTTGHHVAKSLGNYVGKLADEFGFTQPEDGSEDRYEDRKAFVSPLRHRVWWLVHNAVAHPLIAFVPRRFAFKFHDWTSRKLHGL